MNDAESDHSAPLVGRNWTGSAATPVHPAGEDHDELTRRRTELATLEARLAASEAEWLDTLERVAAFRTRYLAALGDLLLAVLRVREDLARQTAAAAASDERLAEEASRAEREADEATHEYEEAGRPQGPAVEPSEDLKKLYREAARKLHPDFAQDDTDRERRTILMAEANAAYASGDEQKLRDLVAGVADSDVASQGPPAELVALIGRIAEVWQRLDQVEASKTALLESDWWLLLSQFEAAAEVGTDLLADTREQLTGELAELRRRVPTKPV